MYVYSFPYSIFKMLPKYKQLKGFFLSMQNAVSSGSDRVMAQLLHHQIMFCFVLFLTGSCSILLGHFSHHVNWGAVDAVPAEQRRFSSPRWVIFKEKKKKKGAYNIFFP